MLERFSRACVRYGEQMVHTIFMTDSLTQKTPHIGQLIQERLRQQHHTVAWLARQLNLDRSNCYRIFRAPTVDTGLLVQLSIILQYDFFQAYSLYLHQKNTMGCVKNDTLPCQD